MNLRAFPWLPGMVAEGADVRRGSPLLAHFNCGSSAGGLGPRRGADWKPERNVGSGQMSEGGGDRIDRSRSRYPDRRYGSVGIRRETHLKVSDPQRAAA